MEYTQKVIIKPPLPDHMIDLDTSATIRSVVQGNRFRTDATGVMHFANGKTKAQKYVRAYDGRLTLTHADFAFGIEDGPNPSMYTLYPHAAILSSTFGHPLSLLFDTQEALKANANAGMWNTSTFQHRLTGVERINGLDCFRIEIVQRLIEDPDKVAFMTLWLARDRNLLPVRLRCMRMEWPDHPTHVFETVSFQQVDDVWWPKLIRYNYLSPYRLPPPFPISHIQEITLTSVNMKPEHPPDYFTDVHPDPGMLVHRVRGGKVVDSWVHGQTSPAAFRFRRDWPGLLLLIACVVAAAATWRQWRRTAAAA
jgi:hypothetical protein